MENKGSALESVKKQQEETKSKEKILFVVILVWERLPSLHSLAWCLMVCRQSWSQEAAWRSDLEHKAQHNQQGSPKEFATIKFKLRELHNYSNII
jgi:hypothetical protein